MKIAKILILVLTVLLVSCVKLEVVTRESQADARTAIERGKARELSDSIADGLLKDDRVNLRNQMEKATRDGLDYSIIDQMFATYGKPLETEFKMDEIGRKTGSGGYDKPMRKFWYALRTTKYEKGNVYLYVEVVPENGGLAMSSFSLVTFSDGVPESLK